MNKIKDKGAVIICVIAIVLIIILVIAMGENKKQTGDEQKPIENNINNENVITEEYVEKQEDGSKVNISDQLKQTKTIDGLEISNIRLVEKDGLSQIVAYVKNPSSITKGNFDIVITALDKNGNKLLELDGFIDKVELGKTGIMNAYVTSDIANAYDITIQKK